MRHPLHTAIGEIPLQRLRLFFYRAYIVLLGWIGNYHIHHFFFGTALLIISNWIRLFWQSKRNKSLSAICYVAGMGFFKIGLYSQRGRHWTAKTHRLHPFHPRPRKPPTNTYIKGHKERLAETT